MSEEGFVPCPECDCHIEECVCEKTYEVTWYEVYVCTKKVKAPSKEDAIDDALANSEDAETEYSQTIGEDFDPFNHIPTASEVKE